MSRAYFFGNMYLSSIQQGIQAAHVVAELFGEYQVDNNDREQLYDWANRYKTMILLNGGYGSSLHDLVDFFDNVDNPYPFSFFKESEAALDNAITSVGIILPEKIYEGARKIRSLPLYEKQIFKKDNELSIKLSDGSEFNITYTNWEVDMMERLNCFRLAS